jgi:hypothetical protein
LYAYQYLVTATPAPAATGAAAAAPAAGGNAQRLNGSRRLRVMYLGDFGSSWRHEAQAANALEAQGHSVSRFHEYLMPSVGHVLAELNSGRYDCLLFYKGRIGARSPAEILEPTGELLAEVLRQAKVPCYTWYVDRAYQFDLRPSREAWMRRVAPLCRVAFVAEGALTQTTWARWHLLREPISREAVQKSYVPEAERRDVAFIGEVYGARQEELAPVEAQLPVHRITGVYGSALSPAVQRYKIILGPRYPTAPGYWGNRLYVVLGHGGFFLAPEVEGMRADGFLPGVHYAPLSADAVADIRYWLTRPEERRRMAQAGQELVLRRFTYAEQVQELARRMEETL